MGFGNSVKQFADKAKAQMREAQAQDEARALAALKSTLGEDINLITEVPKYDLERGKFYDVQAPDSVLAKLRVAGLLRE